MAKPLKLIIFDCDGTLVDSQHMICTAMSRAYLAHNLPVPERETMLSPDAQRALALMLDHFAQSVTARERATLFTLR